MSCAPKFNCWPEKGGKPSLVVERSYGCTHQQMRLTPGVNYPENAPLMVNPDDPTTVMLWQPGNTLIGVLQCAEEALDQKVPCPREIWCNACLDPDCICWPVDPEGGELQQQINDEITAMMLPGAENIAPGLKLKRRVPTEAC